MEKYPALYFPQVRRFISLARFASDVCIIGRDPEASIPISDPSCSRRQFSVVAAGGGYQVEPLSKSVPTLRNGEALSAPALLQHNDRIQCGDTMVIFLAKEEDGAQWPVAPDIRGAGTRLGGELPRVGDATLAGTAPPAGPPVKKGPPIRVRPPGARPAEPAAPADPPPAVAPPPGPPSGPRPPRETFTPGDTLEAGTRAPRPPVAAGRETAIPADPPGGAAPPPGPPSGPRPPRTTVTRGDTGGGFPPFAPGGTLRGPGPPVQATVVGDFRAEMEAVEHPAGEIVLDRDAVIGRALDPGGITLDHPRVSRRHAEVRVTGGKVFLRDLGSANGTFLNGERITSHRELRTGDRIDIGPYSFKFTGRGLVQSTREGNLRVVARNLTRTVRSHSDAQMIRILDDVSLVVEPGEFVCILGSSGSGKSTLMQALSARKPADQGQVFLNEVSLYENFQTVKQSIALVPQKDVLHEDLTIEECIGYTARLRLPPDTAASGLRDAVGQSIDRVDLKHRATTPIKHLSGGQKKRASLANETVSKPELLFLDEVTSGLDEGTDWEMMRLFRRMADGGMTVICVTHTVANVEDFCHKIIIMTPPGMLAWYGPPAAAKRYFGVEKLGDVYRKLAEAPGQEWRDRFRASPEYRRYIQDPLASAPVKSATPAQPPDQTGRFQDELPEVKRQFGILTSRFSKLVSADRKTMGIAFAQTGLIGIVLVLVFGTLGRLDPKQLSLLFFLGISCFWCGCNNASKEIVKERFIYSMERDVNLSVTSYLLSKMIVLSAFGVIQVGLLFAIVSSFAAVPGDGARQFIAMVFSMLAGTAVGLFLSAVAHTEDQASTLVPIALIPQILLAGVIVSDLPQLADLFAHVAISGFWVYRALQAVFFMKMDDANFALMILMVHTVVFLVAAGVLLYVRDARGQMVYGKAVLQRLKG
jgi:ABC-type multidrug transport system ATPase subunit/pSer/pThr/pTyr-binding forkhead associated (FHA) protein